MRGQISFPSILWLGSLAPVICAIVGRMSIVIAGSEQTVEGGIFSGQRIMQGTRTPPSHAVALPSRKGLAEPAWSP